MRSCTACGYRSRAPEACQQRTPLVIGVTLGTCIDDTGYPHAQLLETVQRIKFAQHRGAPEGMQKAAVDMPDLAFRIQHVAVVITQSLHAALAATPLVGFLDPFPLLLPPQVTQIDFGSCPAQPGGCAEPQACADAKL
ncbi:hypothetical protein WR25_18954 [Diploscapter pachys]|uniref:Uncharacterized protein n=1 Tax=Diploscapter pachys TaxID=2018661 RepID=A0A2A2K8G8_9BILA|nr:hypothetical protein WR25_18954 [Diploscapter pachys]